MPNRTSRALSAPFSNSVNELDVVRPASSDLRLARTSKAELRGVPAALPRFDGWPTAIHSLLTRQARFGEIDLALETDQHVVANFAIPPQADQRFALCGRRAQPQTCLAVGRQPAP